jgi:putative FmdB family regulatory protein
MPLYEYVCKKCGEKFDQFVSFLDPEKTIVCPSCGAKEVEKQFSLFGIRDSSDSCDSEGSSFG